jgi:hypothetical protein
MIFRIYISIHSFIHSLIIILTTTTTTPELHDTVPRLLASYERKILVNTSFSMLSSNTCLQSLIYPITLVNGEDIGSETIPSTAYSLSLSIT